MPTILDAYMVDAFADRAFAGNPAMVCPLPSWLPDEILQKMTDEHNLSETAFFVPSGDGFELRWFTTQGEIDLCGHATLATAHVIYRYFDYSKPRIEFSTRFVGPISVRRDGMWLELDFPAWDAAPLDRIPPDTAEGLGGYMPLEGFAKRDYLFVVKDAATVRNIDPRYTLLGTLGRRICVTAPGDGEDCDFVSRFFCPGDAFQEDPVTGSAHSMLIPFWAKRLGKTSMLAKQLSPRGGVLRCGLHGDRVTIAGQARTYLFGKIMLDQTPAS